MHTRQTGSESGLVGYWLFDKWRHGHNGTLQFDPLSVPSGAPVYHDAGRRRIHLAARQCLAGFISTWNFEL
ncbi:MAG TPA: hypothetical protein VFB63_19700 [Bryobacteraceae bacterium]|nr:hypothetical protein [Bryobacteraceae bacterium]